MSDYVGIVLISHSTKIAEGIKELIREVVHDVPIVAAGGADDGGIGTSLDKISAAIEQIYTSSGVMLFYDLGSAKMNAELAIELSGRDNVVLVEAPLVEGAYVGSVESNGKKALTEIVTTIEEGFN